MRTTTTIGLAAALWAAAAFASPAHAASAVAYDSATGAWAYYAQLRTAGEAKQRALIGCRKRGGRHCRIIVACERGGYGRIYRYQRPGRRRVALGASCGWYSVGKANDAAKQSCNQRLEQGLRCGVGPGWYDGYNDGHVPNRCKNAHPSRDPCYR